jgi:hypothetical protein
MHSWYLRKEHRKFWDVTQLSSQQMTLETNLLKRLGATNRSWRNQDYQALPDLKRDAQLRHHLVHMQLLQKE